MDQLTLKEYRSGRYENRTFVEFFINGSPLSELLDKYYDDKSKILDNLTGVLGAFKNTGSEMIRLRQLLRKPITDADIRKAYPDSFTEEELAFYIERYRDELADPGVRVYCCAECGDYECGGVSVIIVIEDEAVQWSFEEDGLRFRFNKYEYFETINNRLKKLMQRRET